MTVKLTCTQFRIKGFRGLGFRGVGFRISDVEFRI